MLADDLLQQAYHLATVDRGKPRQASLRRAISTAYYALFHLLVAECVLRVIPKTPAGLGSRVSRALAHTEMKQVCRSIQTGNLSAALLELQPNGFSPALRTVAEAFVGLQDARHQADYDVAKLYSRTDTIALLDVVQEAFRFWKEIRTRDEATVFLAALLFAGRWSK